LKIATIASNKNIDSLLERKVNLITESLQPSYANRLYKIRDNALAITNFTLSMKTEINSYTSLNINI
jgi:hypothetical protein